MKKLRQELHDFYRNKLHDKAADFSVKCREELSKRIPNEISAYSQKRMQYDIIAEMCEPVIFDNCRFYYEPAAFDSWSDGLGADVPGEFTYRKNMHMFCDFAPDLYERRLAGPKSQVYSLCGQYGDERNHFVFYSKSVMKYGLRGLYENVQNALAETADSGKIELLDSMKSGLLALKKLSDKFSDTAIKHIKNAKSQHERNRLQLIADTAARVPWEAPQNFYEALNTVMFLQKCVSALEGVALETMGRLDLLLYPFYEKDIKDGRFRDSDIYEMILEYIMVWDSHVDYDVEISETQVLDPGYTYTLGGCDENGDAVCNKLTLMFLNANHELGAVYPKIMCRFGANSPKEYLDAAICGIVKGRTTVMLQNDDVMIPALMKKGISREEAFDYMILGCWEPVTNESSNQHCNYFFLAKILEYSVWEQEGINIGNAHIAPIESMQSFKEVYNQTLENIRSVFKERCDVVCRGREYWSKVSPLPLISSSISGCVEKKRDCTDGGTKYHIENLVVSGLPNVVNSLIAIRELCFEKKLYSLKELLSAVRNNWENFDEIRGNVLKCHFWGDESEESCSLMKRICHDLSLTVDEMPSPWHGSSSIGSMLYMEMPRYAKNLRATPDGRKNGDYFSRGFEPTHLRNVESFTSMLNSMSCVDTKEFAANSVINMILAFGNIAESNKSAITEALVRVAAKSNVQALQLNVVTKEALLEAQVDPDKYSDIVVRVCGFSAKFISLSKKTQDEFIERSFYHN